MTNGTTKLFSTSDSRSEYKQMLRSLTGKNKSIKLEPEIINESLLEQACEKLREAKEINITPVNKSWSQEQHKQQYLF